MLRLRKRQYEIRLPHVIGRFVRDARSPGVKKLKAAGVLAQSYISTVVLS